MPVLSCHAVDVYVWRADANGAPVWLVLRRAAGRRYAGQWRTVGGKIEAGETAHAAAVRELAEETGFTRDAGRGDVWALPSVNAFYEPGPDRIVLAPAFVARVAGEARLDDEHDACDWLVVDNAASRLAWPEQARLLTLADRLVRAGIVRPEWQMAEERRSNDEEKTG